MKKAQPQSATTEQAEIDAAVKEAVEAARAAEDGVAGKARGMLNENRRCQHQSSCFRNHDVAGACCSWSFLLPDPRRRFDAEDGSAQCQCERPAPGSQRGRSGIDDY